MADTLYDVVGIGNAIVDVLAKADEGFVEDKGLPKGGMTLIDMHQAEELYQAMGPGREVSGGSAANTLAGIAALGGQGGFIGKVRNDQLGGIFAHDIRAVGVAFDSEPSVEGVPACCCFNASTPKASTCPITNSNSSPDSTARPDLNERRLAR